MVHTGGLWITNPRYLSRTMGKTPKASRAQRAPPRNECLKLEATVQQLHCFLSTGIHAKGKRKPFSRYMDAPVWRLDSSTAIAIR